MVTLHDNKLVIEIEDSTPSERLQRIMNALVDMQYNYAINPNKRYQDNESSAECADLMRELNDVRPFKLRKAS